MALNIKNSEVEKLAADVARLANESKTEAIRRALLERKERLESFLVNRVWPQVPKTLLGKKISKTKEERILGFGRQGV